MWKRVRIPAGNTTNVHYNFVVAKPLVTYIVIILNISSIMCCITINLHSLVTSVGYNGTTFQLPNKTIYIACMPALTYVNFMNLVQISIIISILQSNKGFCLSVCVSVYVFITPERLDRFG